MDTSERQLRTLMIGGLDGDASAHATLLLALIPLLRSYYRRRLSDHAATEDLVQETLIAIHVRRASFKRDMPFTAWLFAIARYKLVDHFRRSRATCCVDDLGETLAADGFEEASNAAMDVESLLATLPARQAEVIRLTRLHGLTSPRPRRRRASASPT